VPFDLIALALDTHLRKGGPKRRLEGAFQGSVHADETQRPLAGLGDALAVAGVFVELDPKPTTVVHHVDGRWRQGGAADPSGVVV
jgi:hypothetical protein